MDYIRPNDVEEVVQLQLTNDYLRNGYYSVALRDGTGQGWVYKSRVRQHEGPLSGTEPLISTSSTVGDLSGDDVMRAHFINVGQGDSTLLEFPCGIVLIDAGGRTDDHIRILNDYITKRTK